MSGRIQNLLTYFLINSSIFKFKKIANSFFQSQTVCYLDKVLEHIPQSLI